PGAARRISPSSTSTGTASSSRAAGRRAAPGAASSKAAARRSTRCLDPVPRCESEGLHAGVLLSDIMSAPVRAGDTAARPFDALRRRLLDAAAAFADGPGALTGILTGIVDDVDRALRQEL